VKIRSGKLLVKNSEYVTSAVDMEQCPADDLPEAVFSGKSNVGKSSLINALCNKKKLAYVGNTPGKTRMLNFFLLNGNMRFVDLPGYGFAKVSKEKRSSYSGLAEEFMQKRKNIKIVIQLLDIRHEPSEDDIQMIDFLNQTQIPFLISVSKCDKLSKAQYMKRAGEIVEKLRIDPDTPFILTSSETGQGIEEIWDAIEFYCFGG